ncbi:MAG: hypothetical protein CVU77_01910 [Elusimicrobia bacterium HGW-Elusimicrobia-1]|jgi:O-antigen ligase|nr:MAG: hypothetical protein CVU77_01910 [Elusimicrobia bacterium HGW-Elusimicrobia-1]
MSNKIAANASGVFFLAFFITAVFIPHPELPDAVKIFGIPLHYLLLGGFSVAAFTVSFASKPRLGLFDLTLAGLSAAFILSILFGEGETQNAAKVLAGFILKGVLPAATAARLSGDFDERKILRCLVFVAGGAAALSFPMLLGYWSIMRLPLNYAPVGNPLPTAAFLLMFLPAAIDSTLFKSRTLRYIISITATAAIFLSFSRGGWSAALLAVGVFAAFSPAITLKSKKRFFAVTAAALVSAVTVILLVAPDNLPVGKFRPSYVAESGSLTHRLGAYSSTAKIFSARPVFGVGFGNYRIYHEQYLSSGMDLRTDTPDNMYLRILCDTGLTGALAFFAFTFYWMRKFWKNRQDNTVLAIFCGLAGFLVNQLTADLMLWQAPQAAYWTLLGLGAGIIGTRGKNG